MTDTSTLAVPNQTAQGLIRETITAVEGFIEDKRAADEAISAAYKRAKDHGLDVPALKRVIAKRAKDATQRAEEEQMDTLYEAAVIEGEGR